MSHAKYIGRVGALAVALGVGIAIATAPAPAWAEPADSGTGSSPDRTALIMGGGTVPTPDAYLVELIKNQYIAPTHPGEDIEYVAVTAPMEAWPITGLVRLLGIAFGPPEVWGPGGAGWWPSEPWWKLSGLFDLTLDQAVRVGVVNLETAMAASGNDHLVIYGISEGSIMATIEKRRLAELYPVGTKAPDIDFVMQGTFNLPNGGFFARFPGLYLPIIDWSFNGPAPTDTQFDTVVINRQYEFPSDVPLYPINLIADLNVFLGGVYVHTYAWGVSLPADPTESPAYQGTHGDTSYYFFETQDLPLFGPLRTLGVPESVIDVFEPFFRVIVELGYDRTIPPWEPTPARLIPTLNPATVATDLVNAIGEGINNAQGITGSPPLTGKSAAGPAAAAGPASLMRTGSGFVDISLNDSTGNTDPGTGTGSGSGGVDNGDNDNDNNDSGDNDNGDSDSGDNDNGDSDSGDSGDNDSGDNDSGDSDNGDNDNGDNDNGDNDSDSGDNDSGGS
jgi:hypothetical protein